MGFTGTVIGMIRAFNSIAIKGASSPEIVASGIAEALVTTATGLIVAVPVIIAFQYFTYKLDRAVSSLEIMSSRFIKEVFN